MIIGKRLNGRYKLLKLVGGGGMANVYLAHDIILDRDVAVKILRLDFSNDDEFIKRFKREAYSITTLSHHNIVNIFDVGEEDGIYYIVMEFIDGLTLKQYINKFGPIPIPKVISIMEQLTSAISHAHQFEIIHRDIKPQNILISDDGTVKVTDFGVALATTATAITQTNSVLGSVHYLSPEQARGGVANKKSDIYSLGIVMFELLTGRPPFSGESAVSIALKHLQAETPLPSRWNKDIPQSVENIVLKATAKDPFHRYNTADEMKVDLITALSPERINEMPFYIPDDFEATRAIPIIKDVDVKREALEETLIVSKKMPVVSQREQKKEIESKEDTKKKIKNKKKKPIGKILVISLIVLLLGGIFTFGIMPSLFFPKDVKVPDISGMSYKKAVKLLKEEGLNVGKITEEYSQEFEEENVIRTVPKAGDVVKEKTEINIYKSIGPEKDTTDDYVGKQYDSIETLLKSFYDEVEINSVESEKPKGEIIKQSPEPGTKYELGKEKLELWVSAGELTVQLQSFLGWTKKSVEEYSNENGLKVQFKEEYSDVYESGLVMGQSPAAGEKVKKGDSLEITLSKGKKETPPQKKEIQALVSYEPITPNMPQRVEIFIEDAIHKYSTPAQSVEITENKTFTINLSIPYQGSAKYKIMRDGMLIIEKEVQYEE